jgi:hypothetical protein
MASEILMAEILVNHLTADERRMWEAAAVRQGGVAQAILESNAYGRHTARPCQLCRTIEEITA